MVEIINCYSNLPLPGTNFIGKHGQSFLIKADGDQILVDTGADGPTLLHNMKLLNIDPNDITHLILTHGHYDHTGGLPGLLDARTKADILPVIGHPMVREIKKLKILFIKKFMGFPELSSEQENKIKFFYTAEPYEINSKVKTTGEIRDKPYKDGIEPLVKHMVNGKLELDPVIDDISVIVEFSSNNIVVITGCAHAGILNILNQVKQLSNKTIKAIIGGTHMVHFTKDEVIDTGNRFIKEFDNPDLYLNHCTDKLPTKLIPQTKTIDILKDNFDSNKVKKCYVGTKLTF